MRACHEIVIQLSIEIGEVSLTGHTPSTIEMGILNAGFAPYSQSYFDAQTDSFIENFPVTAVSLQQSIL